MMFLDRIFSMKRIRPLCAWITMAVTLSWLPLSLAASQTTIESVRIRPSPERTRIVFDVSQPVEHKIFTLENPDRLIIDVEQTRWNPRFDDVDVAGTPIRQLRAAPRDGTGLRVVLDLKDKVKPRSFILKPIMQYGDRLVIDLYTEAQQTPVINAVDRMSDHQRDLLIAIDAGHGGDDPGAIGQGNLYEKDVVLAISIQLAELFDGERGYKAELIRKGDYFLALRERTELARNHQADAFLSIHADAFNTSTAFGASVYAISQKGATSEAARWLAEKENRADLIGGAGGVSLGDKDDLLAGVLLDLSMTASLSASLEMGQSVLAAIKPINRLHKRQVEQAGFVVLKSPDIPSLLIETGYISNPQEASKLATRSHQKAMARSIFNGVKRYMEKSPPAGSYLAWRKQNGDGRPASYQIVRGDTLTSIASKYQVSAEMLKKVNGLRGDVIKVGQVLVIPAS